MKHDSNITFKNSKEINQQQLLNLYNAVGWTNYTSDPDLLPNAITHSSFVTTAWKEDQLIGLARCLSDDAYMMYLQDILVLPSMQGKGLGEQLMQRCLDRYEHVKQRVLLTDNREQQVAFYKKMGFHNTRDLQKFHLNAFIQYKGVDLM